jgi:hypothetical protein
MNFIKYIVRKIIAHFISGKVDPKQVAESQVKIAATHGFMAFQDKEFRRLINFDSQSKVEQDRIFNELVATALILLMALYVNKLPDIKEEKQEYWYRVYDCLPESFKDYLKSIGIPDEFVDTWQKVIDQRWDEYQENKNYTREEFLDELGSNPKHGEFVRDMAVIIETIKITSGLHLTRRRAKPKDPIFNYIQLWLIRLSNRLYDEIGW